MNHFYLRIKVE